MKLIELVIAAAILGIIVAGVGGCESDWKKAEASAREFVKNVPGSTGSVSCTHKDTDGDGYCGCSIFKENGDIIRIDCGCEKYCFVCAEGCKLVEQFKSGKTNNRNLNLKF